MYVPCVNGLNVQACAAGSGDMLVTYLLSTLIREPSSVHTISGQEI